MRSNDQLGHNSRRILDHPILGRPAATPQCTIWVDSIPIKAVEGEPILAAMLAAGLTTAHWTEKLGAPRGLFCGIGLCSDCLVTVDGIPNVRSCVMPVKDGMRISTHPGGKDAY